MRTICQNKNTATQIKAIQLSVISPTLVVVSAMFSVTIIIIVIIVIMVTSDTAPPR